MKFVCLKGVEVLNEEIKRLGGNYLASRALPHDKIVINRHHRERGAEVSRSSSMLDELMFRHEKAEQSNCTKNRTVGKQTCKWHLSLCKGHLLHIWGWSYFSNSKLFQWKGVSSNTN
jgi:hypothetical protein